MYKYIANERFILASSSPRRKELLSSIGLEFTVEIPDCDETLLPQESPQEMVVRLSVLKAETVADRYPNEWVLGADTTVVVDKKILGKPADEPEAAAMLKSISGRRHEVWGGFALVNRARGLSIAKSFVTQVLMRELGKEEIRAFIASGQALDKAGAYAVQETGAALVAEIEGSYTNVVGLNLAAMIETLAEHKIIEI